MNSGGDAAEQVVRLSLEGFEVAARLTGSAAKNVAVLLMAALKEEGKTRGKARLTNMIRSGKELKVFAVRQQDLSKFTAQAKKYGVLYCVLRDKTSKDPNEMVDIIARADDASKINRIVERFHINTAEKAAMIADAQENVKHRKVKVTPEPAKTKGEQIVEEALGTERPAGAKENPTKAGADQSPPSRQDSGGIASPAEQGKRPSVRAKLHDYQEQIQKQEVTDSQPEQTADIAKAETFEELMQEISRMLPAKENQEEKSGFVEEMKDLPDADRNSEGKPQFIAPEEERERVPSPVKTKEAEKLPVKEPEQKPQPNRQTVHHQPKKKVKSKNRGKGR